jgi:L-amino acid N-acyltransferase YncA
MSLRTSNPAFLHYSLYRKVVNLADGRPVVQRLVNPLDEEALSQLLKEVPAGELRFLKAEIPEPRLVQDWLDRLNYRRVLPLAAVDLGTHQMVGLALLVRGRQAPTTVGEIEISVSAPCQNQGLGSLFLEEIIALAAQEGLHWLKAEVAAEQRQAIQAFLARGFDLTAVLEHYFRDPNGAPRDAVLLMCSMRDYRHGIWGPGATTEAAIF